MTNQPPASNHRSLTGFVTKLVGDGATYGFINDEIFFPQTNVSNGPASVGDQVFAECEYSAHLPIKWNATSVNILKKASAHQQRHDLPQQPQDIMGQQQQQQQQHSQFGSNNQVAVTYQQHRQQRQQRQPMEVDQDNINQQNQNMQQEAGDFYNSVNNRPFQPQQSDNNIQPFSDQPMGPPNFTYTSQLGSAFVQNQFVPSPFISQQPPPMLPPQPQQQQQLLPSNQLHMQNNNQRHNNQQHNKGGAGNRFNNSHGDNKSDRQNNRRNLNRNDNKFDRPSSGDRDMNNSANNRSSKSNGSRERSIGRGNKREDTVLRPSPPSHSSARSTSLNSDRGSKAKRHYDVQNVPKTKIMTNMNACSMKQRCPPTVHIPSDLIEVLVNKDFRLDLKNTPKPLRFIIEQATEEVAKVATVDTQLKKSEASGNEASTGEIKVEKPIENPTPPSSRSEHKLRHKYGVKVILISLKELEEIYHDVFGANLDSFNSDGKAHGRLDETISILCSRGSNNGYSLIGGKFDSTLDGFVEGETDTFERHGRKPDLIATCKRVVLETTGLDLGECKSWSLVSKFVYNHKSDYFSQNPSLEYSFIYMPHIWTLLSDKFDHDIKTKITEADDQIEIENGIQEDGKLKTDVEENVQSDNRLAEDKQETNEPKSEMEKDTKADEKLEPETEKITVNDAKIEAESKENDQDNTKRQSEVTESIEQGMKLKTETIDSIKDDKKPDSEVNAEITIVKAEDLHEDTSSQLEEGEVATAENSPIPESSTASCDAITDVTHKRKATTEGIDAKKICTGSLKKEEKVALLRESFLVRSRGNQNTLSLVSIHELSQAARHDQFELSVASNILKESLVQHLSEYILTALVEDHKQKVLGSTSGSQSSSQENSSDSNNNTKSTFKNPTSSDAKIILKEFPVNRYINLAFSYFDSAHIGYIYLDDLNKLLNNTDIPISKRALMSLIGDGDKFNYKCLPDLPLYVYSPAPKLERQLSSLNFSEKSRSGARKVVEYKGITYDLEKLVQQVNDADTLRVSLVDRFNYAIENSDKQAEEIHVLEVSQKSLAKAIKAQNDEICDLKRERDSLKKKFDSVRKGIKGTITSLNDLIREEK